MKIKSLIFLLFGLFCFSISICFFLQKHIKIHSVDDVLFKEIININNPIRVEKVDVINGNHYDLLLEDGRRIKADLGISSLPEAKSKIISFLNKSSNPKVIIRKKVDDYYLIFFYVTTKDVNGKIIEVELSEWLLQKRLLYE